MVLVISLDGRIALPSGGPTFLGGKGDRRILEKALAWSDCTLLGAGTLRAHQSTCLIKSSDLIEQRISKGLSEQPISIVVGTKKDHCQSWHYFQQPINRWLLSVPESGNSVDYLPEGYDRQIFLKQKWSETIASLNKEGLSRIVVLGGSNLVFSLLLEDVIDELQLTIAPRIIGGDYPWLLTNADSPLPESLSLGRSWDLNQIEKLGSSEVMLRYQRKR